MDEKTPLLIVDAANVVGSVPDGWWKDRRGAAERLRDRIDGIAESGVPGASVPVWAAAGPLDVVMVVEGRAKGVGSIPGVRVVDAPADGDGAIVDLVAAASGRRVLVVTADRALRHRVVALGAETTGPRSINRIGDT